MFSFFKKAPSNNQALKSETLSLKGLHCASCAVDIDLTLEELPSVKSKTNYSKSEAKISYDPKKTSLGKIKSTIKTLGYQVN